MKTIQSDMVRLGLAVALLCGLSANAAENTGPNINLDREASGRYAYRTLSDGRDRGYERFELLVHGDGSRTLLMWHDLKAVNAQFTVVLRVADDFRPLSAFASYWVANGYKGNTTFQVDGNQLTAHGVSVDGAVTQTLTVPENFSIGSHPVSGDGWHLWYAGTQPSEGKLNLFSLEATKDVSKPVLGTLVEMPFEVISDETIEVPAGQFATTHYRLLGSTDLWVSGEDRILIKMIQKRFDRVYELVEFSQTQNQ